MKSQRGKTISFARTVSASADWKPNGGRLKGLYVVLVCLTVGSTAFAQGTNEGFQVNAVAGSASSNIEIIKLEWKREVRLPRNFDPAIIPTGGTFNDPATRTSSNTPTSVASDATRSSGGRSGAESSTGTFPATPSRLPVFYVYSMRVKNVGLKVIEGIAWDYIFIDKNLDAEVGRHKFLSYARIPTTKTVTLRADLRTPPISLIGAPTSGSSKHSRYTERAVVQCVLYEDQSVWKNPHGKDDVCEFLKKSKDSVKRNHGVGQRQSSQILSQSNWKGLK